MKVVKQQMIIGLLLGIAGMLGGSCCAADGPTPYPAEAGAWPGKGPIRTFDWFKPTRERYYKNREKDQGAVVFVGDSLTQGWKDVASAFPGIKVANRGIGGDTSRGILFRFQEDVLALHPSAVVILAGTNDLTARGNAADALANIGEMIKAARAYKKEMPIILCQIPASSQKNAPVDDAVRKQINEGLQSLAGSDAKIAVCPLAGALLKEDGTQDLDCYAKDRLHLGAKGYEKWKSVLTPIFTKLKIVPAQ